MLRNTEVFYQKCHAPETKLKEFRIIFLGPKNITHHLVRFSTGIYCW